MCFAPEEEAVLTPGHVKAPAAHLSSLGQRGLVH